MSYRTVGVALAVVVLSGCGAQDPQRPEPAEEPEDQGPPPLADVVGVAPFEDLDPDPAVLEVELVAGWAQAEIALGQTTDVMAYNGSTPGPLLHAREGDRVVVHFHNQLDEPTSIHWHGLRISDEMDGCPFATDAAGNPVLAPVPPGASRTYDFVLPEAGTYWYHPHGDIEQLARGLYGPIVVAEREAPTFDTERIVIVDEVRLGDDGQLAPFSNHMHDIMHGRAGNGLVANGKTHPVAGTMAPGAVERWRLVNAGNSTSLDLSVTGASWRVIGTDGGLLPQPYTTDRITIALGQRYDLEVRVDAEAGSVVRLQSHTIPGVDSESGATQPLAEYVVASEPAAEPSPEPVYPEVVLPAIVEAEAQELRVSGYMDDSGEIRFTVNGVYGPDLAERVVAQGTPVRLRVINELMPPEVFHLQGQFFQIVSRDGIPANEPGLKDSVLIEGFSEVELVSDFDNPGHWSTHSNVPSHTEGGMVTSVVVQPSP